MIATIARTSILTGAAALALLAAPFAADAHEARSVGSYEFVVGFLDEPAFAGEKNGLDLRVSAVGEASPEAGEEAAVPVEGLEETLQAEVIFADQSMPLEISAAWNSPGKYQSVFFPMEPGDYTFRIFGTIEGTEIDESFTSSPEGFHAVQDPEPLRFPAAASASVEVATAGFLAGAGVSGIGAAVSGLVAGAAGVAALGRRARG